MTAAAPGPAASAAGPRSALTAALSLAALHPLATFPCPACAASVKAENLARHLEKTHPGQPSGASLPARLRIEPGRVTLRRRFGLGRRRVALPAEVEIGRLVTSRPSAGTSSYADDYNVPHDEVQAGTYLRLSNGASITIACRTSTGVRKHWAGWTPGKPRRRAHLRLDAPGFVHLQYALATRNTLLLRSFDGP